MLKIGQWELEKEEISIAFMILFALLAVFMLGVRYSYGAAIENANIQLNDNIKEYCMHYSLTGKVPEAGQPIFNINFSEVGLE